MLQLKNGLLIAIEGIDGAGKSTIAALLAQKLAQKYATILTKEPGGSGLGKQLRSITQEQTIPLAPKAEFLLFAADRAQHMVETVLPALSTHKIVISDRMTDSSVVYQGYGRGVPLKFITQVNTWIMGTTAIDITFYIRITAQEAQQRIAARGQKITVFEKDPQFVNRIINGFEKHMSHRSDVVIIDGSQSIDTIVSHALTTVETWITNHHLSV